MRLVVIAGCRPMACIASAVDQTIVIDVAHPFFSRACSRFFVDAAEKNAARKMIVVALSGNKRQLCSQVGVKPRLQI